MGDRNPTRNMNANTDTPEASGGVGPSSSCEEADVEEERGNWSSTTAPGAVHSREHVGTCLKS